MKKIFNKIIILGVAFIVLFSLIVQFGWREELRVVWTHVRDGTTSWDIPIVMNEGTILSINKEYFNHLDFDVERFELHAVDVNGENVVKIENNIIIANYSGITRIVASLFRTTTLNGERIISARNATLGYVNVINKNTMTHITTAEELADMNNNPTGHFILMNDIDLADFGEWKPIGRVPTDWSQEHNSHQHPSEFRFSGMFVNPFGYTISNLTIPTSKTTRNAGLFESIRGHAFIYGIILENIYINVSDWSSIGDDARHSGGAIAGGIAAGAGERGVVILNCFVSGTIIGGGAVTGGIVGVNSSFIIGSTFNGILTVDVQKTFRTSVGGIAGEHGESNNNENRIINNSVYADICGGETTIAGGIIGVVTTFGFSKAYCSRFVGTVSGRYAGTMVGFDIHAWHPIDFE